MAQRLSGSLHLVWTENRRTMLSYRREGGHWSLRLHRMFAKAPPEVVEALAAFVARRDRRAGRVLDAFIADHRPPEDHPRARAPRRSRGRFHDLQALFEHVNRAHFQGSIEAAVTWSTWRNTRRRRRRSIRLGSYYPQEKLIRIHPALDQNWVPSFFIEFILFHEMLHQAVPSVVIGGRRQYHPPEFRRRERLHPDYDRAMGWERTHLERLLKAKHEHQDDALVTPLARS